MGDAKTKVEQTVEVNHVSSNVEKVVDALKEYVSFYLIFENRCVHLEKVLDLYKMTNDVSFIF